MLRLLIILLIALDIIVPERAIAYIDPNTGGYVFQALAPVFFAILGALAFFSRRIINTLKKAFSNITNWFLRERT